MELQQVRKSLVIPEQDVIVNSTLSKPFIKANTKEVSLLHLKKDCTIPVFSKDNECTVAHHEFINAVDTSVKAIFSGQRILSPELRVSHVIKGRIPEAIGKPVKDLKETEKTIYYERMMFKIDIPTISESISGNKLNLVVGGVRAYNQENLYSKKNFEKFKVFIGFKNIVCTNLCVSSDGLVEELRAVSVDELKAKVLDMLGRYEMQNHLNTLKSLSQYSLTEKQFAKFLGKCRMYNYLPKPEKGNIPALLLNDGQINTVAKGYYDDNNFSRQEDGSISLWKVYNLLTEATKSSYIDSFLTRSLNSYELIQKLADSLQNDIPIWYLN
ncbi:hypothetical protein PK35_15505 [Tamlana nanhaiensis]|uniref:DUF3871 family protein n=1 Tax=Neotamlana nanhaiensis TaxID=1382798 RepID=A0A0D7VWN8_9FLAO|nr:DUF3871 family protein [Tamlana nanhaiensis]KJD31241.1 hypothetical protein PK35_15505 [Tamlana nanhaiensis]